MIETMKVYEKNFSKILNVQESEQILYNLCTTNNENITTYGIEIILKNESKKNHQCTLTNLSNTKSFILDILKFLYENSIKPDSAPGIISDIFSL